MVILSRVWSGSTGKYIGFLGQPKPFVVPRFDTTEWIAPYDINEVLIANNYHIVSLYL